MESRWVGDDMGIMATDGDYSIFAEYDPVIKKHVWELRKHGELIISGVKATDIEAMQAAESMLENYTAINKQTQ